MVAEYGSLWLWGSPLPWLSTDVEAISAEMHRGPMSRALHAAHSVALEILFLHAMLSSID